jgi:hypothetical protein
MCRLPISLVVNNPPRQDHIPEGTPTLEAIDLALGHLAATAPELETAAAFFGIAEKIALTAATMRYWQGDRRYSEMSIRRFGIEAQHFDKVHTARLRFEAALAGRKLG